jgi:AP-1 complex subunit gamma-1
VQAARLTALVDRQRSSVLLEVQSRSCEYARLLASHNTITPQLLERMPALDESEYSSNLASGAVISPEKVAGDAGAAAGHAAPAAAAPASDDLVDLLGGLDAASAAVGRVSNPGSSGGGGGPAAALDILSVDGSAGGIVGLDDLLGPGPGTQGRAPPPAAVAVAAPAADIFSMLGGESTAAAAPPPAAAAPLVSFIIKTCRGPYICFAICFQCLALAYLHSPVYVVMH